MGDHNPTRANPNESPQVICLTPVKNEAWILDRFLRCASLWADHIIVADQCSDDKSREIAAGYPKVTLIDNDSPSYDEGARQRLLLSAAREIPAQGKRILLALDADEMLTANWRDSAEWRQILASPPGTVIRFEWANIQPGFKECWIPKDDIPYGFVDDGRQHSGQNIHSLRLPSPEDAPTLRLKDIKLLHYQYASWERMQSKQRWYQCWERINHPAKRAIQIYRQYNFMRAFPSDEIHPVNAEWLAGYEREGIDMTNIAPEPLTWWDREILCQLEKFGVAKFRKIDIWDVDWEAVARKAGVELPLESLRDPRSQFERTVHRWLAATQSRCLQPRIRYIQRALRLLGW